MPAQLAALQRWMREVVTHPDGVAAGARAEAAQSRLGAAAPLDRIVTGSPTLPARQRLEIYQHGYFRRLLDCLASMMPVLRHALGDELFELFALEYLRDHPPRSYTLARLDDGFVDFLQQTRPDRGAAPDEREDWPDFVIDLATLEHRIRVTFDGPGAEGRPTLAPATIAAWSDRRLLAATLIPVPCLHLATYRFPVRDHLLAVRRGEDPPLPAPRTTHVVFNRREFRVRLLELERPAHDLLSGLASGRDVADSAARAGGVEPATVRRRLLDFAEAGLFLAAAGPTHEIRFDTPQGAHR